MPKYDIGCVRDAAPYGAGPKGIVGVGIPDDPYGKSIIVGASIARPRGKTCEFAEIQCESVHRTARTANGRPYMFISFCRKFCMSRVDILFHRDIILLHHTSTLKR